TGNLIDLISNVLLIALIGFALFRAVRSPGEPEPVANAVEPIPATEPVAPTTTTKPGTVKPGKKLKS
ncbi:MAG: hypothetical protein H7Z72_26065, partial [Bacteroidetes bacterium]|nr:hypothetical protein [Fibrella sp.]